MKEYNFSGISTEKLENAIQTFNGYACAGISCNEDSCPFNINHSDGGCKGNGKEREHKLFKEELKRREEKEMNTMPELKAGMIVEFNDNEVRILLPCKIHTCGLGLYLNDGSGSLDPWSVGINKLWSNGGFTYYEFFKNGKVSEYYDLIWSKKSDTQIKINELSETINKANAQIEELRKGLE